MYMHVSCLYMCHIHVCVTHRLELKDLHSPWCGSAGRVDLLCPPPPPSVPSIPAVLSAFKTLGGSAGAIFHHILPNIVSDGHFAVPLHPVRQCGIFLCAFPPPAFQICPCCMFVAVWLLGAVLLGFHWVSGVSEVRLLSSYRPIPLYPEIHSLCWASGPCVQPQRHMCVFFHLIIS